MIKGKRTKGRRPMKKFHSKNEQFVCTASQENGKIKLTCAPQSGKPKVAATSLTLPYIGKTVVVDEMAPELKLPYQNLKVQPVVSRALALHGNGSSSSSSSSSSCSSESPPLDALVSLDGQNCIAKEDKTLREDERDLNKYLTGLTYKQLCKWINDPIGTYTGVTNPSALSYTLDPPLVVPPGQKGFNMVEPFPFTPDIDLSGRNVLVVGASRNIGLATATLFVNKGCNVVGTSRHPDCYKDTEFTYPLEKLDIRSGDDVKDFFCHLMEHHFKNGKIDVLILMPGIQWIGDMQDADGEDLSDLLSFQVGGFQRVVYRALPFMKHSNSTRVISMGSQAGEVVTSLNGYGIGKRALQFWNDCHMLDALRRKAMGESTYEPTFTLVEPGVLQSTIGLHEKYVAKDTNIFDVRERGQWMAFNANQSATTVLTPILVGAPPCPADPSTCGDLPSAVANAIYQIVIAPQPSIRYLVDPAHPLVNFAGAVAASNILSADDALAFVTVPVVAGFFWDPASAALGQSVLSDAFC
jgi:NAD(P)-dependent dehydrogenase (short-subunit alcohol dehydrogenase family)